MIALQRTRVEPLGRLARALANDQIVPRAERSESPEQPGELQPPRDKIRRESFDAHVREQSEPAFKYALWLVRDRGLAEDLVQEAFVRAWQSPKTPLTPAEFRAWIYRIVGNLARNELRRATVQQAIRLWTAPAPDPVAEFELRSGDPELVGAIKHLSTRDRTALYLHYYEDRPVKEVAATLQVSEGAAHVLLHRAIARLRGRLALSELQDEVARP